MIVVEEVVYEYPQKRALDGVSFTAPRRSVIALVGPNGAGKSTLLRCLAALDRPFSGKILVDGIDVAARPRDAHERIGFLSDFFGLYDDLTVAQSLRYAALARRAPRSKLAAAIEQAAERVNLSDRMNEKAGQLSRGLRQRLGIAMAIVHEPQLLLLDEPAAGLDPEARRALSRLILSLRDGGMTLVVSSHILAELEDYCDRMVAIDRGRIRGGGVIERQAIERVSVAVTLAAPAEHFAAQAEAAGAVILAINGDALELAIEGGAEQEAALLKALVAAGLPVRSFAARKRTLEDAYFAAAAPDRSAA